MKKRSILNSAGGVVVGVLAALGVIAILTPRLILKEQLSPYDLAETVAQITNNAVAKGWVVSSVMALDESVKKHGGGQTGPVRLVNLCQAQYAAKILNNDRARIVSVVMPCTIAVYEKSDGRVAVGTMNTRLFGGVVAEVMAGPVARDQHEFVAFCRR